MSPFETTDVNVEAPSELRSAAPNEDVATALLRDKNNGPASRMTGYDPLVAMIPPTSNHCERLFSKCKLVKTPQRSSLLPDNFESLMFLQVNRTYWEAQTLVEIRVDEN